LIVQVCGADAPGVSCSSAIGLAAQEALDMCMLAGAHPKVHFLKFIIKPAVFISIKIKAPLAVNLMLQIL
jgi:hypothetical protein